MRGGAHFCLLRFRADEIDQSYLFRAVLEIVHHEGNIVLSVSSDKKLETKGLVCLHLVDMGHQIVTTNLAPHQSDLGKSQWFKEVAEVAEEPEEGLHKYRIKMQSSRKFPFHGHVKNTGIAAQFMSGYAKYLNEAGDLEITQRAHSEHNVENTILSEWRASSQRCLVTGNSIQGSTHPSSPQGASFLTGCHPYVLDAFVSSVHSEAMIPVALVATKDTLGCLVRGSSSFELKRGDVEFVVELCDKFTTYAYLLASPSRGKGILLRICISDLWTKVDAVEVNLAPPFSRAVEESTPEQVTPVNVTFKYEKPVKASKADDSEASKADGSEGKASEVKAEAGLHDNLSVLESDAAKTRDDSKGSRPCTLTDVEQANALDDTSEQFVSAAPEWSTSGLVLGMREFKKQMQSALPPPDLAAISELLGGKETTNEGFLKTVAPFMKRLREINPDMMDTFYKEETAALIYNADSKGEMARLRLLDDFLKHGESGLRPFLSPSQFLAVVMQADKMEVKRGKQPLASVLLDLWYDNCFARLPVYELVKHCFVHFLALWDLKHMPVIFEHRAFKMIYDAFKRKDLRNKP